MEETKSTCPFKCGCTTITNCSWCHRTYWKGRLVENGLIAIKPKELNNGDKFQVRKTTNSRIYVVTGLVLKLTRENGFKFIPTEDQGKIKVPCDSPAGELLMDPEKDIYLIRK